MAKVNQSGQEEARFIYATRSHVPDYMVASGTTYRLITDQLGSVRQVVNASTGAIAQEITYDPFGEVISDSNPGFQPFGFAGGLYEPETGLTHFGAREYDTELGRWTSVDSSGFDGGDANLYGYVLQDPVNLVDFTGYSWQDVSDFASGFGDKVTFGGTNKIREKLGVNDVVNKCSGWYDAGGVAGTVTMAAAGGAGAAAAKTAATAGRSATAVPRLNGLYRATSRADDLPPRGSWPPMPNGRTPGGQPYGWSGSRSDFGARYRDSSGRGFRIGRGTERNPNPNKRGLYTRTNHGKGEGPHQRW